jgi:hypothetical protein
LRLLAASSDDPEYPARLAGVLRDTGHARDGDRLRASAAARYDRLALRHPEAFAHHAADFWLTVGGDTQRGLRLASRDLAMRRSARAYALLQLANHVSTQLDGPTPKPTATTLGVAD